MDKLISATAKSDSKIKKFQSEIRELRAKDKKQAKDGRLVLNMQMLVRDCLLQPELAFISGQTKLCADFSSMSAQNQSLVEEQSKTLDYSRIQLAPSN